jgi:hypothetical protein
VGRVAERGAVRAPAGRGAPAATPLRARQGRLPRGAGSAIAQRGGPARGPRGDPGAPLPLSAARTRPGGSRTAARRSDGTTTMGRERSPRVRPRGLTTYHQREMRCASRGGFYLDTAETAGSPQIRPHKRPHKRRYTRVWCRFQSAVAVRGANEYVRACKPVNRKRGARRAWSPGERGWLSSRGQ